MIDLYLHVIDAFHLQDYARASHLCREVLTHVPEDALATALLAKIERVRDQGHQLSSELRITLHRAERMTSVGDYAQAREICEMLQDQVRELGVGKWEELASLSAKIERLEDSRTIIEAGDRAFVEDRWQEALRAYRRAFEVSPDHPLLRSKIDRVEDLLAEVRDLEALSAIPCVLNRAYVDQLLDGVYRARRLLIDWPDSHRLASLAAAIDQAVEMLRDTLNADISECLNLVVESRFLKISNALFRRVETLLEYLKRLPETSQSIDVFSERMSELEIRLELAEDFECLTESLVTGNAQHDESTEAPKLVVDYSDLDLLRSSARQSIEVPWETWRQIKLLKSAIETCDLALSCSTLDEITGLRDRFEDQAPTEAGIPWVNAWRDAYVQMQSIVAMAADLGGDSSDEHAELCMKIGQLDTMAADQAAPLKPLVGALSGLWLRKFCAEDCEAPND